MQMAINLQELALGYYAGTADPRPQILNRDVYPDLTYPFEQMPKDIQEAFTFNPTAAKKLLAEAGYPNGFKQTVTLSSVASTEFNELADLFSQYFKGIGIETKIEVKENADYISFIYSGNQTIMISHGYGGYWMPMQVLTYYYKGQKTTPWNFSNVDDPVYNDMIDKIMVEPDAAERDRLTREAGLYGTGQYWGIVGPVRVNYRFWNPWLKNYNGEDRITAIARGPVWARVWTDRDLKFKMTGKRD